MKVYREKPIHTTGSSDTILDMERLNAVKSIGIRKNYALIMNEFSICQSGIKGIRKNTIEWGRLTLFRIPSIMEVYARQLQSGLFCVLYKSKCSPYWRILGVDFTGVLLEEEYTFIGEI